MTQNARTILSYMQGMKSTKVHVFSKKVFDRESADEAVKRYGGSFVYVLENERNLYIIKGIHPNVINDDIALLKLLIPVNGLIKFPKHSFCSPAYIMAILDYVSTAHITYEYGRQDGNKYIFKRTVNDFI